jgi:hypothetical protein
MAMTRQAISPRLAIRILENIRPVDPWLRVSSSRSWPSGYRISIARPATLPCPMRDPTAEFFCRAGRPDAKALSDRFRSHNALASLFCRVIGRKTGFHVS